MLNMTKKYKLNIKVCCCKKIIYCIYIFGHVQLLTFVVVNFYFECIVLVDVTSQNELTTIGIQDGGHFDQIWNGQVVQIQNGI